ncbi:MAG: YdeI/OmpD-associated family protein [Pseudomonadota bacterium]
MDASGAIDLYISEAEPFAQPILNHVRALVHKAVPEAEEAVKWGMPYFTVQRKNAVGMAAFKHHAAVVLCSEGRAGGGMGSFGKIASLADLPGDQELMAKFRLSSQAAGKVSAAKPKSRPSSNPAPKCPDDLAKAIAGIAGARAVFDNFTEAQRRDYIARIASAKREATRAKRVSEAAQWIGEGKRRNWKYEKR